MCFLFTDSPNTNGSQCKFSDYADMYSTCLSIPWPLTLKDAHMPYIYSYFLLVFICTVDTPWLDGKHCGTTIFLIFSSYVAPGLLDS